ncbi:2OG-Fe(II) oxygenase [Sphingomonas bacterium]|uniref:2OG-Fe(II) oxygenase n=1 Tax=Sphingomonas bacterium TaxID=1895847 RepID=UPI001C2CDB27|nr:2OG-Fe(II) oxygenase [Sphingomonas bacterium]
MRQGHSGVCEMVADVAMEADIDRLDRIANEQAIAYAAADPFPHIVIDDFVRPDMLEEVLAEVSGADGVLWNAMQDRYQQKFSCATTRQMGPRTRQLINFMNGQEVLGFLERLTGITGLVPDWQLAGGGIHALRDGGFLNVHADFNLHRHLRLDRRINLLLYLNKDWREEYGGGLELWDTGMTACQQRIMPLFNRCVIFNTTDRSFHGNPVPVAAPDGRTRLSLAFYYYTNGRPESEAGNPHSTLFRHRPGEETAKDRARKFAKKLTPPIITEWLEKRRN